MVKHPDILMLLIIMGLMLWAGYEWRAFYRLGRHGRRHRRTGQLWKQDERQRAVHAYLGMLLIGAIGASSCLLMANRNPILAAGGGFGCLAIGYSAAMVVRIRDTIRNPRSKPPKKKKKG